MTRSATLLDMPQVHVPVLAAELVDAIDPRPGMTVVDGTFGAGGHARLVAERLGTDGTLIAIDRDPTAHEHFAAFSDEVACRTRLVKGDFASSLGTLLDEGAKVDGVYLDLGISSMQVDNRERGFAYAYDAPLDMRMDPTAPTTAADLVNEWDHQRLAKVIRTYGEERYADRIARELVKRRPLSTTTELVDAIVAAIPAPARFGGGHPAKRTFQALRIAVNDELAQLDAALPMAWRLLAEGGVLAAISFHSLEDRPVKRFLVEKATGCICPPDLPVCACGREPEAELIGRGVAAGPAEVASNPRSKSARLRAARKLRDEHEEHHP